MMNIFLANFTEYQNVIQIDEINNVKKFEQSLIYINLKESQCIDEIKEHHKILIQIKSCTKCHLSFIFFSYVKFVERILDVKFNKLLDICKTIKSFIDLQKKTFILENDCVEFLIINAQSQHFIFFKCKEHEHLS